MYLVARSSCERVRIEVSFLRLTSDYDVCVNLKLRWMELVNVSAT